MAKPAAKESRKKQGDKLEALIDEAVGSDSEQTQKQAAPSDEEDADFAEDGDEQE